MGEIAPLPEFSQETLEQAKEQTVQWLKKWVQARSANQKFSLQGLYPSVAFGLSCALAEMEGELVQEGNYQVAPLCYGDPDELYDVLNQIPGRR